MTTAKICLPPLLSGTKVHLLNLNHFCNRLAAVCQFQALILHKGWRIAWHLQQYWHTYDLPKCFFNKFLQTLLHLCSEDVRDWRPV
jgi:hypothetical protein